MKTIILLLLILSLLSPAIGQKHDHTWVLGHNGGTIIDFNTSPPGVAFVDKEPVMRFTNASISSEAGELLCYTNGCDIFNANHEIIENGANINPGSVHSSQCDPPLSSYTNLRGAMFLPSRNGPGLFYLLHCASKLVTMPFSDVFTNRLYYSLVDMGKNSGLGKVLEKNQIILEDTFHTGDMTAVKHANNLDWWIIMPKRVSNMYFKVLLTDLGFQQIEQQAIGDTTLFFSDGGGQAVFSPDGTKYVRYNPSDDIMLFDFDRSTGELSNYRHIPVSDGNAFVGGAAISPNSRYLYISAETKFFQFDLEAPDIAASEVLLGEYDGFQSPFATTFFSCQLAPDCKIYCTCSNSADRFHVVYYPDEPGPASGFVQHGLQLASSNAFSIPNFPNYRLGSSDATCQPVAVEEEAAAAPALSLSPNPASGWVRLTAEEGFPKGAAFSLFDLTGRPLRSWPLSAGGLEQAFPLAGLAAGMYIWRVEGRGRLVRAGKVAVLGN